MSKFIAFILLLITISLTSLAQGKIFSQKEADDLFGPVKHKVRFNTKILESFITTHKQIMFKMDNRRVNVLGEKRRPILKQFESKSDDVYHLFDSEIIKELLTKGANSETYIETRDEVLSVSNGTYVMEIAFPCPPCCPECPDWPWPPTDD